MDSQDPTALINSLLNSPSLTKYIEDARTYIPLDTILAPWQSPSGSHYQTRSRAPFSPPRTAVTRQGHVYHVTDSNFDMYFPGQVGDYDAEDCAPVIHIPDGAVVEEEGLAGKSANNNDTEISADDVNYVQFKEILADGTDLTKAKPMENMKADPNFYPRKKDEDDSQDEYAKIVPAWELRSLMEDHQQHPIGLEIPVNQLAKEPPIVTRSAARCKSIETGYTYTPSPSTSPMKLPAVTTPLPLRRIQPARPSPVTPITSPTENDHNASTVAARTRAQIAKSPLKTPIKTPMINPVAGFKKPLPVADLRGKRQKTGPSTQQTLPNSNSRPVSPSKPSTSKLNMPDNIKDRFAAIGRKYTKFLTNSIFSEVEKAFIQQMLVKSVEQTDSGSSIILAEYVLRVVELLTGERSVIQVQPYFEAAKQKDLAFVCVVFGVLVVDDSPLILDLLPLLYGKTRLIKAFYATLRTTGNVEDHAILLETFKKAFKMNDAPAGQANIDITSPMAVRLAVTGREGLIDASLLQQVAEEEVVENTEEILAEIALSEKASSRAPCEESSPGPAVVTPKTLFTAPQTEPINKTVKHVAALDFSHILESQSDGSNSSMHASPFTPNPEGPSTSAPASSAYSTMTLPVPSGQSTSQMALGHRPHPEVSRPRRVPLITTALTFSPLKDPRFEDPVLEDRRKSLRSSLRRQC